METQNKAIARNWYLELITGVLFIAAGVWVYLTPVTSYVALSIFFAITFLLTGIVETATAFQPEKMLKDGGGLLPVDGRSFSSVFLYGLITILV